MLDFASDIPADGLSAAPAEQAASNDQALLDAYSNAVIGVTERVGPAVVRVETGPKVRNAGERGGLGSGIVISPDDRFAYVQERNTNDVVVIDLDRSSGVLVPVVDGAPIATLTSDPMPQTLRRTFFFVRSAGFEGSDRAARLRPGSIVLRSVRR